MQFTSKFAAFAAIAALSAVSLVAADTPQGKRHWGGHGRMGAFLSKQLNLTDAQKEQTKAIFQDARQSAQPLRQQLAETRKSLHAAIQANNSAQIQQLSTVEGTQLGQLASLRNTAFAKAYQVLTPEQQQKLADMRKARQERRQSRSGSSNSNTNN